MSRAPIALSRVARYTRRQGLWLAVGVAITALDVTLLDADPPWLLVLGLIPIVFGVVGIARDFCQDAAKLQRIYTATVDPSGSDTATRRRIEHGDPWAPRTAVA